MNTPLDSYDLWRKTLGAQADSLDQPREVLRQSFLSFRTRVADLVSSISSELPGLTVHDITHLDALWRVAYQIAGDNYPLNPAEAYVLGGAFLLHDAAHVLAAYPGRMQEIRQSIQWQDLIAQRYGGSDPVAASPEEKAAIFQVLRDLHAAQAHRLATLAWAAPSSGEPLYLIENVNLRNYYADLIGEIAASHHWSAHAVSTTFSQRKVSCPAFLSPAAWEVDALKVALLLRTADAAHLDGGRAPWFLFALRQPQGISANHWRFQAKLGQPSRTSTGELRLNSGSSFTANEREAWWLAFDAARMVDGELRSAHEILREEGRQLFAATSVLGSESPEAFARQVPVQGWVPVDAAPKVGDLPQLITRLGGSALYGENQAAPVRELLQNGLDAVRALRSLGGLGPDEGSVEVTAHPSDDGQWWLRITDTGLGMSRYVLTNVLLDFGASLWAINAVRDEHPGLSRAKFSPVGKFGIGFFSVFMLGSEVLVTTRRFEPSKREQGVHWQLRFDNGLSARPALLEPPASEQLPRPGTCVAVKISAAKFEQLLGATMTKSPFDSVFKLLGGRGEINLNDQGNQLAWLMARLCPTSPVRLTAQIGTQTRYLAVDANDWAGISDEIVLSRSNCEKTPLLPLHDSDGRLIGRVGLPSQSYFGGAASIVYQGVICGQASGLAGLIQARANNADARRATATPDGDLVNWVGWAEKMIAVNPSLDLEGRLRLHPLLQEHDLAVWQLGKEELTLKELVNRLVTMDELVLHDGIVEHDSDDDVSAGRFKNSFDAVENLICVPSFEPKNTFRSIFLDGNLVKGNTDFPWSIGAVPINYRERLLSALAQFWGRLDDGIEELIFVGEVDGAEITRSALRYRRCA